jgi:AraC-like DNA-binding protein
MPFQCKVEASPEEPVLALVISVDPTMLSEILINLDEPNQSNAAVPRGIYSSAMTDELRSAVIRLLGCLNSPSDSRILGPQTVREIVYRVLQGEQGGALRAMAARNDQFMRIARVLQFIHTDFASPLSTEDMAKQARMSVSTFHQNFKAVTATSPLQYLKNIRLHRARLLMVNEGHNASTAATAVGYESASQFGREFKRLFGGSPADDASKLRDRLVTAKGETLDRWVPTGLA